MTAEGIGIILGVDRVLDMSRTVVNVSGDIVLAAWVDKTESPSLPFPKEGAEPSFNFNCLRPAFPSGRGLSILLKLVNPSSVPL